jgi:hypothetical protein
MGLLWLLEQSSLSSAGSSSSSSSLTSSSTTWLTLASAASLQVAVYSPADRLQSHRYNADESYQVGHPDMQPVSCYLDIESIIKIAKEAEVDAIHPGYGFLSENTTFARRCEEEGIVFIGPKAETIEVGCYSNGNWQLRVSLHLQSLLACMCKWCHVQLLTSCAQD